MQRLKESATLSAVGVSAPIVLDYRGDFGNTGLAIVGSGTHTTKVQYTLDDVFAAGWDPLTANWIDSSLTTAGPTTGGKLDSPATAVRLNMTAWTAGSAKLQVVDGSGIQS